MSQTKRRQNERKAMAATSCRRYAQKKYKTRQRFQMLKQIYSPPSRDPDPPCSSHIGASSPNWKTHSTNEICVIPAAQRRREGFSSPLVSFRLGFCCLVVAGCLFLAMFVVRLFVVAVVVAGDATFWDSCAVWGIPCTRWG